MLHRFIRLHHFVLHWRSVFPVELIALFLVMFVFVAPASADMRFQNRSLYMNNAEPGATSQYTVSFSYMSPAAVGSVDLLVCNDPIPYHECVAPTGFDASQVQLSDQRGETGFSILSKSSNHIVLSRLPSVISNGTSAYTFDNVKNPTDTTQAFSIRLRSHASLNATGPQIDFGSVRGEATDSILIETQVPPMLIFCVAQEVESNCTATNDTYYSNMGTLDSESTLVAQSQMAVGTNASGGFAITAMGTPMAAGVNVIDGLTTPTESIPGDNQFGINLVENTAPAVGRNPDGTWANAIASPDYSVPNKYKYVQGDVVAFSPNVSLMKKFTVSYIVNSSKNLRPGVYTTTMTYIASGRF